MLKSPNMNEISMDATNLNGKNGSKVIKRAYHDAADDEKNYDIAKRCRYDMGGHFAGSHENTGNGTFFNTYESIEDTDYKPCPTDNSGDNDMDVDCNYHHLFSQTACEKQQSQEQQQLLEQQYLNNPPESQSSYQDRFNKSYTIMGHVVGNKPADFPDNIDDVENMYHTTHGGDFMRHLNSYAGEDL